MRSRIPLLTNVKVAAPCPASWEEMPSVDGDRVRFCQGCSHNVYNLSAMTQAEAEGLLRAHEGRLCVRYYQRSDGKILTQDCPIGAYSLRLKMIQRSAVVALLVLVTALWTAAMSAMHPTTFQGVVNPITKVAPVTPTVAEPQTPSDPPPVTPPTYEGTTMGMVARPSIIQGRVVSPTSHSDTEPQR